MVAQQSVHTENTFRQFLVGIQALAQQNATATPAINVNVAPPNVNVQHHSHVKTPDVSVQHHAHVASPVINVATPPTPHVHVAAPIVNVETPRIVNNVNVEATPAPNVHVAAPTINVETPHITNNVSVEAPTVNVEAPPAPYVHVEAPTVNLPHVHVEAPVVNMSPTVNVETPQITNNINVEAPPTPNVQVDIAAPEPQINLQHHSHVAAPVVNVAAPPAPVVHTPITVAPALNVAPPNVNIAPPNIHIDNHTPVSVTPQINVETPNVQVQNINQLIPPEVNVPDVHITPQLQLIPCPSIDQTTTESTLSNAEHQPSSDLTHISAPEEVQNLSKMVHHLLQEGASHTQELIAIKTQLDLLLRIFATPPAAPTPTTTKTQQPESTVLADALQALVSHCNELATSNSQLAQKVAEGMNAIPSRMSQATLLYRRAIMAVEEVVQHVQHHNNSNGHQTRSNFRAASRARSPSRGHRTELPQSEALLLNEPRDFEGPDFMRRSGPAPEGTPQIEDRRPETFVIPEPPERVTLRSPSPKPLRPLPYDDEQQIRRFNRV